MQKFKESFRAGSPIEIGQLQSAPRSVSAGRRKRRSRPRVESPGVSGQDVHRLCPGSESARKSGALSPGFPLLTEPTPLSPRGHLI